MKHSTTRALAVALLFTTPALATGDHSCVVDYETLEVRHIAASDPETLPQEQALLSHDWAFDSEVVIEGQTYVRQGLPRRQMFCTRSTTGWSARFRPIGASTEAAPWWGGGVRTVL